MTKNRQAHCLRALTQDLVQISLISPFPEELFPRGIFSKTGTCFKQKTVFMPNQQAGWCTARQWISLWHNFLNLISRINYKIMQYEKK